MSQPTKEGRSSKEIATGKDNVAKEEECKIGISKSVEEVPKLCLKNCGFFGSLHFKGFCSACFKAAGAATVVNLEHSKMNSSSVQSRISSSEKNPEKSELLSKVLPVVNKAKMMKEGEKVNYKRPGSIKSRRSNQIVKMDFGLRLKFQKVANAHIISKLDEKMVKLDANPFVMKEEPPPPTTQRETTTVNGSQTIPAAGVSSEQPESKTVNETTTSGGSMAIDAESVLAGKNVKHKKPDKLRCSICTRSIMVIGFDCRCGGRFCIVHRLAKEHFCRFDYRQQGLMELSKINPKVISDKIRKI